MATEVIIPALGVVVESAKIIRWLKKEGDEVTKGDPLIEIESEKVSTEVIAPASGILGPLLYPEGAEVPITKIVTVVLAKGESLPDWFLQEKEAVQKGGQPAADEPISFPSPEKPSTPVKAAPAARKLAEQKGIDLSKVTPTGPHGTIMIKDVEAYLASTPETAAEKPAKATPVARKVAEDLKIPLAGVPGTGIQGRVMKEDVLRAVPGAGPAAQEEGIWGKVIPMNSKRQVIARRMAQSAFSAPHIYFFTDVKMEGLIHLRDSIMEDFEKAFGVRVSINDLLIRGVALAIREFPLLNSRLQGEKEVYINPEINIGLAVALDEGLIVPAIPCADRLGLGKIAQLRFDLVARARQGKLTHEEIDRGTFTISSLANFDITFFTAILNPPQTEILSVGKMQEQLYLEKGEVKIRRITKLGLSVDHRIIDGAVAAQFLQRIKKNLENPYYSFLNL
ncbi:MAG: 2-oxo acid dehydrogenase subunit E2 [Syntrophaceae bacterium]|nr:2-oxo acid dehydrogenase subunit E2 [Syntrophaceae bacterium]